MKGHNAQHSLRDFFDFSVVFYVIFMKCCECLVSFKIFVYFRDFPRAHCVVFVLDVCYIFPDLL